MDILDIDEVLKDDSFIFLEDKTHDDISNILQQWKSSNCLPSSITAAQQQQFQQQRPQIQVNKLDIRKFVRPKRKSTQNLDMQFAHTTMPCENSANTNVQCQMPNENHPMLNLQIGGLVTTMEKSFLQDTSPPSFLCSMDNSINSLSNSLVTSADFTNISFLQSPNSLYLDGGVGRGKSGEVIDQQEQRHHQFNITNGITAGRNNFGDYTLTEMLRDRKILESLFISNDGTFIKDSHIGQIDDISLALSKTASSCSTIENSTGSDEDYADVDDKEQNGDVNRTVIMCSNDHTFNKDNTGDNHNNIIDDDNIAHNLIENRTKMEQSIRTNNDDGRYGDNGNQQEQQQHVININELERVMDSSNNNSNTNDIEMNKTFDYSHINDVTPNGVLSPVDNVDKNQLRFCESTPLASSVRYPKQNYASKLHAIVDTNISPITQTMSPSSPLSRQLNITYEQLQQQPQKHQQQHNATYIFNSSNNGTFTDQNSNNSDKSKGINRRIESKATVGSPNLEQQKLSETYNAGVTTTTTTMHDNTMNLSLHLNDGRIEANLLTASKNEEEFDHMLDKFGKIQLNSEQLIKMKKSLASLKKRFNCNTTINQANTSTSVHAAVTSEVAEGNVALTNSNENIIEDLLETHSQSKSFNDQQSFHEDNHNIMHIQNNRNNSNSTESNKNSPIQLSNGFNVTSDNMNTNTHINLNGSSCGERLLSRRSRLYDDINLAAISLANGSISTSTAKAAATTVQASNRSPGAGSVNNLAGDSSSTSALSPFTINNQEEKKKVESPITHRLLDRKDMHLNRSSSPSLSSSPSVYNNAKRLEKLQNDRDRDRFKTIVISKNRNKTIGGNDPTVNDDHQLITNEFNNVPCDLDSTAACAIPAAANSGEIVIETIEEPDVESNNEPIPDRFRTIKIKNKNRFPQKPFNVPCIDDNVHDKQYNNDSEKPLEGECILMKRYSRCDQVETTTSKSGSTTLNKNSNSRHSFKNYFTYKKQKLNPDDTAPATEEDLKGKTNTVASNITKHNVRPEARTLSRPRFISGLTKLSAENKATSADELQKTTLPNANRNCSNYQIKPVTKILPSKNAHFYAGTSTLINGGNLKSPMGVKSKSFHNLSSNLPMSHNVPTNGISTGATADIGKAGQEKELSRKVHDLRKPSGIAINGGSGSSLTKLRNSLQSTTAGNSGIPQQKSDDAIFKIPRQVSGIRAPTAMGVGGEGSVLSVTATGAKRAGLVRPSSGFYSLNVVDKSIQQQQLQQQQTTTNCTESNIGRHSSTDSMSSVSSKSSTHSLSNTLLGVKQSLGSITVTDTSPVATNVTTSKLVKVQTNLNLQQLTIASSGIPKPSGLRPPTNMKQRLPRPGSFIRSDK